MTPPRRVRRRPARQRSLANKSDVERVMVASKPLRLTMRGSAIMRREFLKTAAFGLGVAWLHGSTSPAMFSPLPQKFSAADTVTIGKTGIKTSRLAMGTGTVGGGHHSHQTAVELGSDGERIGARRVAAHAQLVEVDLARINSIGADMGADLTTVTGVLREMRAAGKGVVGMERLEEGELRNRQDESLRFALAL